MTSSSTTVASPQPQRRRNRWLLWTGRILLGLLALIVLLAVSGGTYEAISFELGETHPFYEAVPQRLHRASRPYAWASASVALSCRSRMWLCVQASSKTRSANRGS